MSDWSQPPQPLWKPGARRVSATAMDKLRRDLGEVLESPLLNSQTLYDFSIHETGSFWDVVWGECDLIGLRGEGTPYVPPGPGQDLRSARFFPAARLNYAENLLAGGDRDDASEIAIVSHREDGRRRTLTWAQLREQVSTFQNFLLSVGVGRGDTVAAWMPNIPETVVAMLAASSVGAVFTSTSPDFGVSGVLDRFGQVEPVVLIVSDGYFYGGKAHDRTALLSDVLDGLPTVREVVRVEELAAGRIDRASRAKSWSSVLEQYRPHILGGDVACQRLPFDHPGFVLYSSGTTGKPKCMVHRAAGLLLKHVAEHRFNLDIGPGDRVFYYTTCGWMMWNWLVSALALGATIVLYDGSPFHRRGQPDHYSLWDIAVEERATLFGVSAKYIDACRKAGLEPRELDLSAMRTVCSTGSPLNAEGFEWVYESVKEDVHLASMSGGTDLCGCFVMGDPTRPVYAGEIQGPALGMAVDVWDSEGKSLRDEPGCHGELVCTQPFPSMPLEFLDDPDGIRYQQAYFDGFPGIWTHGDFASWTDRGGIVIHGRSDATLNAGGVRIGTAEIYRQVELLDEVLESLAVGQSWDDDTRIVLFVRLAPGAELDEGLVGTIKRRLREQCSPRHVPAKVIAVTDLPRTRTGKLAELAVADVIHGREVRNIAALDNPDSLAQFHDLDELQR